MLQQQASHGFDLDSTSRQLVEGLFSGHGLKQFADALMVDRAYDQNGCPSA